MTTKVGSAVKCIVKGDRQNESYWGAMGAPPVAESSDLSEWPRSTDAKERRRRRQMSGTATGIVRRVDDLNRVVIHIAVQRYTTVGTIEYTRIKWYN